MTWLAVLTLAALYVAAMLRVAYWLGGLLRDAEVFLERETLRVGSGCLCQRHAVNQRCPVHGSGS